MTNLTLSIRDHPMAYIFYEAMAPIMKSARIELSHMPSWKTNSKLNESSLSMFLVKEVTSTGR